MNLKIIESEDGSHTLFNPDLNETYHSHKGAFTESVHVFIKEGLKHFTKQPEVSVLEVGFGTGLNAVLSLQTAIQNNIKVNYHTLEPFPLPAETVAALNYASFLPAEFAVHFTDLHSCAWNTPIDFHSNFSIYKHLCKLEDFEQAELFDLIYFDAFAPSKQAEVWSLENLEKCYRSLKPGGFLITYCAQGQFKRNLKAAGFTVESLEGPPGKKEMTRARK